MCRLCCWLLGQLPACLFVRAQLGITAVSLLLLAGCGPRLQTTARLLLLLLFLLLIQTHEIGRVVDYFFFLPANNEHGPVYGLAVVAASADTSSLTLTHKHTSSNERS